MPVPFLPSVLRKIKQDRVVSIVIAPRWPRQFGVSSILQVSECPYINIQSFPDLLTQDRGKVKNPNPSSLHLTAPHHLFGWVLNLERTCSEVVQAILNNNRKECMR